MGLSCRCNERDIVAIEDRPRGARLLRDADSHVTQLPCPLVGARYSRARLIYNRVFPHVKNLVCETTHQGSSNPPMNFSLSFASAYRMIIADVRMAFRNWQSFHYSSLALLDLSVAVHRVIDAKDHLRFIANKQITNNNFNLNFILQYSKNSSNRSL